MSFKTIQWVNIFSDCIWGSYVLQTFAMPPQPQMQLVFTAQYTGKSVWQLVLIVEWITSDLHIDYIEVIN